MVNPYHRRQGNVQKRSGADRMAIKDHFAAPGRCSFDFHLRYFGQDKGRPEQHPGGPNAENHEEETIAPKYLLRCKGQNGRQVKAKKRENIPGPERRRGKHARHGRAQESKDKSAEQSISHDARVCLARIETGYSSEVQWPKRHAKNSGEHAFWKKDPEWFPA